MKFVHDIYWLHLTNFLKDNLITTVDNQNHHFNNNNILYCDHSANLALPTLTARHLVDNIYINNYYNLNETNQFCRKVSTINGVE